jgi:hypothetical protein
MGAFLSKREIKANKTHKVNHDQNNKLDFRVDFNLLEERRSFFGNHEFFSPHTSPKQIKTRSLSEDSLNIT